MQKNLNLQQFYIKIHNYHLDVLVPYAYYELPISAFFILILSYRFIVYYFQICIIKLRQSLIIICMYMMFNLGIGLRVLS